jgi:hypothetical protein
MTGVGQTWGDADQAVALPAHLPAQPGSSVDRNRFRAGLAGDLSGVLWPAVLVHI